jgi:hypothetical protein
VCNTVSLGSYLSSKAAKQEQQSAFVEPEPRQHCITSLSRKGRHSVFKVDLTLDFLWFGYFTGISFLECVASSDKMTDES